MGGGSGSGGGTSREVITEAVQNALDGLKINGTVPVVDSIDKTGKPTYKSNNVDFTIEVDNI
jgi:DNA topoisomerase VI subunit B